MHGRCTTRSGPLVEISTNFFFFWNLPYYQFTFIKYGILIHYHYRNGGVSAVCGTTPVEGIPELTVVLSFRKEKMYLL